MGDQTVDLSKKLGVASAVMVALGYPGEIQDDLAVRWFWWALAMVPFCYVVQALVGGLNEATEKQPDSVKSLVVNARYLTAISWLTYPFVYIIKNIGLAGARHHVRTGWVLVRRCDCEGCLWCPH